MDDLVSRQAVHAMINSWTYNFCDPEDEWAAMKEVKDLPSAQPEPSQVARDIATIIENEQDMMVIERNAQQWIPCSERLPKPDDRVLVITNTADYYVWDWLSFGMDNYLWEDESGYFHDKYEVIAWMPLPEYKGEQE